MARAIDTDKAIEVAQIKYNDWNLAMAAAGGQREINLCFKKQELFKAVKAVLECVPTLTPPNEWVSVDERLPKYNIREDGELISSKILCYCETDKTVHLVVSQKFYTGRKGEIVHPVFRYYDEWGDEIENVSHWMPLPAPPDRRPPEGEA